MSPIPAAPMFLRFDAGELTIAGERWQGSDGELEVVLLHGGGQTRHSWKRTAQRLNAAGMSVTALDARGHGDSDWHPGQNYEIDGFVADLRAFSATLPSRPVLVGASLGGITSLVAAGENPGLARAVVLVDVVVKVERAGVDRILDFMSANPNGFADLDEVADAIAAYNPHRPRPTNLEGLRKNVRLRDDGRWYWHWDPSFLRIRDEPTRHIDRARLSEAAARLDVPVLIIRGMQSDVVSDDGLDDMLRVIPKAEVVDIHGAGHMVAGDDNDLFGAALEEFLRRLPRR